MPSPRIPESTWQALRIAVTSGGLTLAIASQKFDIPLGTLKARSARQNWFNRDAQNRELKRLEPTVAENQGSTVAPKQPECNQDTKVATSVLKQAHPAPLVQKTDKPLVTVKSVADGVAEEIAGNRERFKRGMSRALAKAGEKLGDMDGDEVIQLPDTVAKIARAGASVFGDAQSENGGGLVINIGFLKEPDPFDEIPVTEL